MIGGITSKGRFANGTELQRLSEEKYDLHETAWHLLCSWTCSICDGRDVTGSQVTKDGANKTITRTRRTDNSSRLWKNILCVWRGWSGRGSGRRREEINCNSSRREAWPATATPRHRVWREQGAQMNGGLVVILWEFFVLNLSMEFCVELQ